MTNGVCKKDLMDQIYLYSFAVDDAKLFLDTHPEDEDALAYFYEFSRMRNQALKEYAKNFGPLTIDTVTDSCSDNWDWIDSPWPWQEGGC
mgnify:FL=1